VAIGDDQADAFEHGCAASRGRTAPPGGTAISSAAATLLNSKDPASERSAM
jgi:hypothetical protein